MMRTRSTTRTPLATAAVAAVAALALTGCSGGSDFADSSAEDIITAASEDMQALESVHIDADITTDGQQITLDISLDTDGACTGTVGLGEGTAEIVSVDGQSWFKADQALYEALVGEQAEQITAVVGDNWVADEQGQFGSFCDLDSLLEDIGDPEAGNAEKDGTEEVDGEEAVRLVSEDEGDTTTAFVAVDEPHHILRVEVEGDNAGEATFSEFDETVEAEAPAEDEIVELPGA
ncbi:hypothetical protein [Nocardioides nanhaiensis]|uniref:Lipoprotein n=1 Tax=Nocardioides nanhaiensis TaxID=1476871 RepID=A0ABP8WCM2_9ACTN